MAYSISNEDLDRLIKEGDVKADNVKRRNYTQLSIVDMWKVMGALKELREHRRAQTPRD